jgi:hypothetical protein
MGAKRHGAAQCYAGQHIGHGLPGADMRPLRPVGGGCVVFPTQDMAVMDRHRPLLCVLKAAQRPDKDGASSIDKSN